MKKVIALLLCAAMLLALAACGSSSAAETSSAADTEEATEDAAPAEEATTVAEDPTANEAPSAVEIEDQEGAISFPLDENVTYTIFYPFAPPLIQMGYEDPAELNFFKTLEEWTNVTLDFTVASVEVLSENFNLVVASGDYPDIFSQCVSEYTGGGAAMIEDEVIIDLADYLDEYAPNYTALRNSNASFKRDNTTDDGAVYEFMSYYTNVYVNQGYFYRTDYAEALGMDAPETMDDWYDYLLACKNQFGVTTPSTGVTHSPFYGYGENDFIVRDGEVVYTVIDDEIQSQMMPLYEKWFGDGLYTVETQIDGYYTDSDLRGMVTSGEMIMTTTDVDQYLVFQEEVPIAPTTLPTLEEGGTAYRMINQNSWGHGNTISTSCENVETLVAYMDYWYTDAVIELANWGIEGETFTRDADGNYSYTDEVLNFAGGLNLATSVYCAGWEPTCIDFTRKNAAYNEDQLNALSIWNEFDSSTDYPQFVTFTTEEQEIIKTTFADIQTYVDENFTQFKVCEKTYDNDFEAFVQQVYDMGMQDVLDVYQAAYDRYCQR